MTSNNPVREGRERVGAVTHASRLVFDLDYPREGEVLFSNVSVATGWCSSAGEEVRKIELVVNGRSVSETVPRYPRLDVVAANPGRSSEASLSGFRCEFDPLRLPPGENVFEFRASTDTSRRSFTRNVVSLERDGPLRVSDVFVDIVGSCNLRCRMCPQGDDGWRRRGSEWGVMPVGLFESVVSFLIEEQLIGEYINLYNWGEPLLHPQLASILSICRDKGIRPVVSTNLSVPTQCLEPLEDGVVDLLLVSASGFSKDTYEKNHVGGDFDLVQRNLEALASSGRKAGKVVLKFLVFLHNEDEIDAARGFAEDRGLCFGAYQGAVHCVESFFRCEQDESYREGMQCFLDVDSFDLRASSSCPQETVITLNHRAELQQCCVSWGIDRGVSVFDADVRNHLENKTRNEFCARCLASGYAHYRHFGIVTLERLQDFRRRGSGGSCPHEPRIQPYTE